MWHAAIRWLRTAYAVGASDLAEVLASIARQCNARQWDDLLRVLCELDPGLAQDQPGRAIRIIGQQHHEKAKDWRTRRKVKHGRG